MDLRGIPRYIISMPDMRNIIAYLAEYSALSRTQQAIYRAIAVRQHGLQLWSGDVDDIAAECCCSRWTVYRAISTIRRSTHLKDGVIIL